MAHDSGPAPPGGTKLVTVERDEELEYWRTLATERGKALEALYGRLHTALELISDEHFAAASEALTGRMLGWMKETDRIDALAGVRDADVLALLDDLWKRVAADVDH